MREEVDAIRSCIAQMTAVIAELQDMEDQDEVHDSLLDAKDAKHDEESKLLALHEVIVVALEETESQGHNVAMLDNKMKVVFSRARDLNESFIELLRERCSAIRVSITKDRRLSDELEALGQRADVLKYLEYMREMVARDSARVGILEQLLAGAHVGMRLKAEYVADMGETV
uniref:Uncharacterized protein n=1 Tax=Tanacetum cinerariifolium TaxID=118510 RepID=A0A6L2NFE6_TANCI|nr:hypothetical protein [Tanacetum cinerariifolium]